MEDLTKSEQKTIERALNRANSLKLIKNFTALALVIFTIVIVINYTKGITIERELLYPFILFYIALEIVDKYSQIIVKLTNKIKALENDKKN